MPSYSHASDLTHTSRNSKILDPTLSLDAALWERTRFSAPHPPLTPLPLFQLSSPLSIAAVAFAFAAAGSRVSSERREGRDQGRSLALVHSLLHSVREKNKKCIEATKRGTKGIKKVITISRMALAQYMFKLTKKPLLLLRDSK